MWIVRCLAKKKKKRVETQLEGRDCSVMDTALQKSEFIMMIVIGRSENQMRLYACSYFFLLFFFFLIAGVPYLTNSRIPSTGNELQYSQTWNVDLIVHFWLFQNIPLVGTNMPAVWEHVQPDAECRPLYSYLHQCPLDRYHSGLCGLPSATTAQLEGNKGTPSSPCRWFY